MRSDSSDGLLIYSFKGKPQASLPEFADAFGLPLNENTQSTTYSTSAPAFARAMVKSTSSWHRKNPSQKLWP